MKATGVVRKIDDLGRLVIPMELRRTMEIEEKDPMEIFVDGEQIIIKKYQPACIFCGEGENVKEFKGKKVCKKCLAELK